MNVYPADFQVNCFFRAFPAFEPRSEALQGISHNDFIISHMCGESRQRSGLIPTAGLTLPWFMGRWSDKANHSGYLECPLGRNGRPSGSHSTCRPSSSVPVAGRCLLGPCLGVTKSSSRRKTPTNNMSRTGSAYRNVSHPEFRTVSCTGGLFDAQGVAFNVFMQSMRLSVQN